MRLLKTGPYVPGFAKLEVIQKWGSDIPPYAILSHTWSTDPEHEVLLADVQNGTCSSKPAYSKLEKAMERAMLDGYGWLWIDTCCIDKTSSVELSEAINSMYTYYKNAQKCYAYLIDVTSEKAGQQFKESRWFRRGWTLQELIAPSKLEFYNSDWTSMGHKHTLHETITEITGIEEQYLTDHYPPEHASVAKRMSWAASRQTTREEDLAYSLIGIFDINMPMLYGEGATKAFLRLQEEIIRTTEDQSLFAWVKGRDEETNAESYHGLLADSPKDFARTGNTVPYTNIGDYNPSTMTARGLNITLPLTPKTEKADGIVVAVLNCPVPERGNKDWLAIYLKPLQIGREQYARVDCKRLASISAPGYSKRVFVRQHFPRFAVQTVFPFHFFQIRSFDCSSDYKELSKYKIAGARRCTGLPDPKFKPTAQRPPWSLVDMVYQIDKTPGVLTVALWVERVFDHAVFVIMLGTTLDSNPAIHVYSSSNTFASYMVAPDKSIQPQFSPGPFGDLVELELHNVRVNLEEQVRFDQKIYFVDIEIRGLPRAPTAKEIVQDAVDIVASTHKRAAKAGLGDKMKRLLPTG